MNRVVKTWALAIALALTASVAAAEAPESGAAVKAFVSILPQAYFVERVGGPHVSVNVLVGLGQDVHTFDPTPKIMTELAKAQVFFRIGFPFEETIVKKVGSAFKNLKVVDSSKGITPRVFQQGEEDEHRHNDGHHGKGRHRHGHGHDNVGENDPHVWLNPKLAKVIASNVAEVLRELDPTHSEEYSRNLEKLQAELDALDAELAKVLAPFKGKAFYVYHPAWGYFADAYGLKQVPVEIGGKEPSGKHLAALVKQAKADGVQVIFVQPQFSKKSAETLANAIGGAVVPLDDLARDYMNNMREIARKIEASLGKPQQ